MRRLKLVWMLAAFIFILQSGKIVAGEQTWYGWNEGFAKAKTEKKMIIVDFYTDWCHWCKVMDEKTFRQKDVAKKLFARFVPVRINAEKNNEFGIYENKKMSNVQLTRLFGVNGYPSLAFIDSQGQLVTLIPGYVPAETFLTILNYMDDRCFEKQVSFDDYIKKGNCKKAKFKS